MRTEKLNQLADAVVSVWEEMNAYDFCIAFESFDDAKECFISRLEQGIADAHEMHDEIIAIHSDEFGTGSRLEEMSWKAHSLFCGYFAIPDSTRKKLYGI